MSSIDISNLLRDVNIFRAQLGESELAVQANVAATDTLMRQEISNQVELGNLAAIISDAVLGGQRITQEASQRAALQLGEDAQDSMGRQRERAARLLQAQDSRRAAVDKINQKNSTSLLSDPVGYIYSLLTINEDIDAYNAANRVANTTQAEIAETNALLTKQVQNFKNTEVTITEASKAAAADKLRLEAQNNALLIARNSYAAQNQGIMQLLGMKKEAIYATSSILDAQAKQISIENAQESLRMARAEAARRAEKEAQQDAVGTYLQENIVAGMKVLYPNSPEKWDIGKSAKMLALISGRVPLDGEMKKAFDLGVINSRLGAVDPNNPASPRMLGTTPNEVFETLEYKPVLSPGQQVVVDRMIELRNQAMQDPQFKLMDPKKDGEKAKEFINKFVREGIAQDAKRISNPDNLFALPSAAFIVEKVPALQNTVLAQKIIIPLTKAGVDISEPNQLYAATLDAVMKGEAKLNDVALDLSVVYRHAQRINIEAKGFVNLGIAPKESYNVPIRNSLIGTTVVDMADPNAIRRRMVEDLAKRAGVLSGRAVDTIMEGKTLPSMPEMSFGPQITFPPQPGSAAFDMYGGNARKNGGQ